MINQSIQAFINMAIGIRIGVKITKTYVDHGCIKVPKKGCFILEMINVIVMVSIFILNLVDVLGLGFMDPEFDSLDGLGSTTRPCSKVWTPPKRYDMTKGPKFYSPEGIEFEYFDGLGYISNEGGDGPEYDDYTECLDDYTESTQTDPIRQYKSHYHFSVALNIIQMVLMVIILLHTLIHWTCGAGKRDRDEKKTADPVDPVSIIVVNREAKWTLRYWYFFLQEIAFCVNGIPNVVFVIITNQLENSITEASLCITIFILSLVSLFLTYFHSTDMYTIIPLPFVLFSLHRLYPHELTVSRASQIRNTPHAAHVTLTESREVFNFKKNNLPSMPPQSRVTPTQDPSGRSPPNHAGAQSSITVACDWNSGPFSRVTVTQGPFGRSPSDHAGAPPNSQQRASEENMADFLTRMDTSIAQNKKVSTNILHPPARKNELPNE